MTYCVGLLVDTGLVLLSDSRTNAGVDQINTFRKMATFQRQNERELVLLSAGNLAITQAVVNLLHEPPDCAGGAAAGSGDYPPRRIEA
jgi:putative proteasome-type protease